MEFTPPSGNRAADDKLTEAPTDAPPDTNGQGLADDLSDLPADFGKAKTKATGNGRSPFRHAKAGDDDQAARLSTSDRPGPMRT